MSLPYLCNILFNYLNCVGLEMAANSLSLPYQEVEFIFLPSWIWTGLCLLWRIEYAGLNAVPLPGSGFRITGSFCSLLWNAYSWETPFPGIRGTMVNISNWTSSQQPTLDGSQVSEPSWIIQSRMSSTPAAIWFRPQEMLRKNLLANLNQSIEPWEIK